MRKKLKVVYVITGLNAGGVEHMLLRSVKETAGSIESVVVSLTDLGVVGAQLKELGVKVYTLEMGGNPLRALKLFGIFRRERPDVVQCKMYHANLVGGVIGRLSGIKNIFWGIHHTYLDGAKFTTKLVNALSAFLARFCCKKVVCCGELARDICVGYGYPPDKLKVMANGYDVSALYPDESARMRLRGELSIPDGCFAVGHMGRYHKIKNHAGLIEAFALFNKRVPNSMLFLVGPGVDKSAEIKVQAHRLGLAEKIVPLGPTKDVKGFFNAMDMAVLFSFGEAFPNVLAEAMLCGKIAVSSDVGDARFIVGNDSFIVPVGDIGALSGKMEEIAKMPEKARRDIGAQARESIVGRFDIRKICSEYESLWLGAD